MKKQTFKILKNENCYNQGKVRDFFNTILNREPRSKEDILHYFFKCEKCEEYHLNKDKKSYLNQNYCLKCVPFNKHEANIKQGLENVKDLKELRHFFKEQRKALKDYFLNCILNTNNPLDLGGEGFYYFLKGLKNFNKEKAEYFYLNHPRGRALSVINALEFSTLVDIYFFIKTPRANQGYYPAPHDALDTICNRGEYEMDYKNICFTIHSKNPNLYGFHKMEEYRIFTKGLLNALKNIVKLSPKELKAFRESLLIKGANLPKEQKLFKKGA